MVGIAAGQPLDTLRVRLQQRGCKQTSVAGVWKEMGRKEGIRGLYKGMSYPIYTTALQVGQQASRQQHQRASASQGIEPYAL